MKLKTISINLISLLLLAVVVLLSSCEGNETPTPQEESIIPENFSVEIPSSLSDANVNSARFKNARTKGDTISGNDIYQHLGSFINVGKYASTLTKDIIAGIVYYHINRPMVITIESDEDGRTKNIVVEENAGYDGQNWEYMLTITDADSEGDDDGGKGLQVFWNRNPVKGIALIKPYNINRDGDEVIRDVIFRIDYSEAGEFGYDAHMMVSIADIPVPEPLANPWAMGALKMFVGKTGDVIDIYGNSNHPNAIFFAGNAGFNWAFVASGDKSKDIGVAEVGLPPSNLDETSREVLLEYYSIKNVFTREINEVWPSLDPEVLDAYLANTEAPGYFDNDGFISGGSSPGEDWDELAGRLQDLSPFNPTEISNLTIDFK